MKQTIHNIKNYQLFQNIWTKRKHIFCKSNHFQLTSRIKNTLVIVHKFSFLIKNIWISTKKLFCFQPWYQILRWAKSVILFPLVLVLSFQQIKKFDLYFGSSQTKTL